MTTRPTDIQSIQHWEDSDLILMARVRGADGQSINQGVILSVVVHVFGLSDRLEISPSLTPSVASCVFDTLQTDARWTADKVGYNFRLTVPALYFPVADWYRVEVLFTPVAGGEFPIVCEVNAKSLWSS